MKRQLMGAILGLFLLSPLGAEAAEDMTDSEYQAVYEKPAQEEVAEKAEAPVKTEAVKDEREKSGIEKKREATKNRFKKVGVDQSYTYYADTKNMRWVYMPNSREQMIDVWIKMVNISEYYNDDSAAKYATNYYLKHYYLRPKTQQIQFLCELEVNGRPSNQVKDRAYNINHWENLVPGSIEDTIYHAVLDSIEEMPTEGKKSDIQSLGDGLEDVFRIAL